MDDLRLTYLENCSPGSLIRANFGQTEWAIVGHRSSPQELKLLVLSATPYLMNVSDGIGGISHELSIKSVANYGSTYHLDIDHSAAADVYDGALFNAAGSVVKTNAGQYISCQDSGGIWFFKIGDWAPLNSTPEQRIAFSAWHIYLNETDESPLISFPAA